MKQKEILVFSIALGGYSSLFRECIKSQKDYCQRHDFEYLEIKKSPIKLQPEEAAWLKLFLLREALKCPYKWIAFLDADCEVRPHSPSFVSLIKETGKSIFMGHGFSGRINSGVIFIKNNSESFSYLDTVIKNVHIEVPDEDKAIYENGHMIYFGKNNPNIQIIDSKNWNNNIYFDPESFIQHYSGGILREKYFKTHVLAKRKYKLRKKIKNFIQKFSDKNQSKNIENLNSILPNFLKKYPQLDKNRF